MEHIKLPIDKEIEIFAKANGISITSENVEQVKRVFAQGQRFREKLGAFREATRWG